MYGKTLLAFLLAFTLLPDEGQWLPTQVRQMDWQALEARGMQVSKDQFWHPENGGVLSATVHINGCTASFVSADGLLITNHHCGFGAISALSTVESNFLRDGFAAADRSAELHARGVTAFVLKRIEDVTAVFHEAQAKAASDLERWDITQQVQARLVAEGQNKEPDTVCSVASFLEGQEYHLYYRTRITDVRLCYAPPRAVGEFGGEVDNWEWPRHTGDFALFRAYVAPDGTPRAHHAENVPFRPRHWLKVSTKGVQEGDLAIVMGYPGRTQRYRTSTAVRMHQGFVFPKRERLLTDVIGVLEQVAATSEERALALASRIKSLANVQKNARGMVWGLERNAVVARKLREEREFQAWVDADAGRKAKWGSVLQDLLALDEQEAQGIEKDMAIGFAIGFLGQQAALLDGLMDGCGAALRAPEGRLPPPALRRVGADALTADLELLQRPLLEVLLGEVRSLPEDQRPKGSEALGAGPIAEAVEGLLQRTRMTDAEARAELFGGGLDALRSSDDPLVALALGLAQERDAFSRRTRERQGRQLLVGRAWIEAQQAFRGKSFYPDANNTLRVSIATVKGYAPRDGVFYTPHTTVQGLLQKETGREPFANPPALLAAAPTRQQSRFFDRQIGDVPVCFLTDGDTTGGNSGSPVVNGRGELVGINFDRVFEAVSGDFGWSPERSRNISVDVRFVLWVIESVFPAPAVLAELTGEQ
jgi:hypothetical protein